MFAYICDDNLRIRLNASGKNYWDVYLGEISEQLGLRGPQLALKDIEDRDKLAQFKVIIIGWQSGEALSGNAGVLLDEWVRNGGMLIGFGLQNLDRVFGIRSEGVIKQTPDDYSISGYFELQKHSLTADVHSPLAKEQKLVIVSDIRSITLNGAEEIGRLYDLNGKDTNNYPAVTWMKYGKGFAGYFAFDAAKTIWLLHQGRPIIEVPEGESYTRTTDLQILGKNSRKVAYADEILLLLQNMIGQYPMPFIYQIPPKEGKIADALFIWGGDGCSLGGDAVAMASNWMKAQGLPYHINVIYSRKQQAYVGFTFADARTLQTNGHELSLHYDFTSAELTKAEVKQQNEHFVKQFSITPVCTVNHCCCWTGWAEPARWMGECGGKADNSFFPRSISLKDPDGNGPCSGFGYGTAYPFFFYDDYRGGNARLEFIEEPIINYELGHRGSVGDKETCQPEKVREMVDLALHSNLVMDWLYHGVYIARYPACRETIQEILRYIKEKKALIVHMANDQLCKWWLARSRATLADISLEEKKLSFLANCDWPDGMAVKIPFRQKISFDKLKVLRDGQTADHIVREKFGTSWCMISLPAGSHKLDLTW